ncbi:pyridoxamine 5'-phosphate oxidase family protein [Corynebacterium sputi]|uniref:pyridoxamine 5'-phosphate oxidase family protein n=1 Tax=Corynebacterium sputi TaxID=489915 RepID=UPI000404EF90|nr:pyridoxamine 5'-phosphate oxidase family protein [Corynebacterium sputi]
MTDTMMSTLTDPMAAFDFWIEKFRDDLAHQAEHAWPPHPAPPVLMTLSTVGPDGYPRTRNVMVSSFTGTGTGSGRICFHTDSRSEKASQLEANPRVSATILAPDRSRQITVIGVAVPATDEENATAYSNRSRYLQILAWLNDDFQALLPIDERHRNWDAFGEAHPDLSDCPPSTWAGYAIIPREFLFWQGDVDGPSQRTRFLHRSNPAPDPAAGNGARHTTDTWTTEVLPG